MKIERRFVAGAELRAKADGRGLEGYAAVFNSMSEDLGGFRESIRPGAFARAIRERQDVRCLFNHNPNMILGRARAGTLQLAEDSVGLRFECDLPNTSAGRDVRESIRRGDVSACSFGFIARDDRWDSSGTRRELLDVDLLDVSPVTYPAYPETSVSARSLWPDGIPVGVQSHRTGTATGCYTFHGIVIPAPELNPQLELERCRARVRLAQLER